MENITDEKLIKDRKYNQNLYKLYKMISWDLLFYYAISYLFLVQVKGLSTSQIIFADAFYPLFKLVFQLPCTILIEKIGKKNSLVIGNISIFTYVLIVLGLSSIYGYIISNIFCALGFIIKGIAESNLLYDSIENNEKKRTTFSKIDGFSSSLYYYFDAITSSITGFLFVINPYIPMSICLFFTFCSILLTLKFKTIPTNNMNSDDTEINPHKNSNFIEQFKFYIRDLKQAFKFISQSKRLRALILFNAIFATLLSILTTIRRSLLRDLNVPNEYFGILFAIWGLIAGFSSNSSTRIQKRHGNHTLTLLSISYTLSVIFSGLTAILIGLPPFLMYFIVLIMISIQYIIKGPFYTLIKRYLGSFSTSSMRTKIWSATIFIENIACTLISFIVSYITSIVSSAIATLIIGIAFFILIILNLIYMKSRVGLKPEEYSDSDIKFNELY